MPNKKWIKLLLLAIPIMILIIGIANYLIDPYGIYNPKYFNFIKTQQVGKSRLIKAVNIKKIKPVSIILGTSRAEGGFDPRHKYFPQPSYNLGVAGSSMYESKLYFENALKQKRLKKVLLVADFIMFNAKHLKAVNEFDEYFKDTYNAYQLLFNFDTLKDSMLTVTYAQNTPFYINGYINPSHTNKHYSNIGHKELFDNIEKGFYKNIPDNYLYKDTKINAFNDFEKIVELSYENGIELDIIFGPSHVKLWEVLDNRKGIKNWFKWKKDVVMSVNKVAKKYNKKQFKITDFSIYHSLTSERVPDDKSGRMEYHWESSHYKNKLGSIVLDKLNKDSNKSNLYIDFGVELSLDNIDTHIKRQKINRDQYMKKTNKGVIFQ
jgi:hypothetical protein